MTRNDEELKRLMLKFVKTKEQQRQLEIHKKKRRTCLLLGTIAVIAITILLGFFTNSTCYKCTT